MMDGDTEVPRPGSDETPENNKTHLQYDNPAFMASANNLYKESILLKNNFDSNNGDIKNVAKGKSTMLQRIKSLGPWLGRKGSSAFTRKNVNRRLPILEWLPKYSLDYGIGDMVAGITVGLTLIPQGLAFSSIVGVPTEYGLYGSFMGCLVYIIFGSCKDISVGPTAIQSLLAFQAAGVYGLQHVVLLCFLTGFVQAVMGILGLGFLVDFISDPVSSGFASASSLIVVASLMKDILGIKASGKSFLTNCISLYHNIQDTKFGDAVVGFSSIIFLFIVRYIGSLTIGSKDEKTPKLHISIINKSIWFVGIARNALLVLICGLVGFKLSLEGEVPFKVIGEIPAGLPHLKLPPFGYGEEVNGTTVTHSFTEMFGEIGTGVFAVAVVGLLEDIAVCKVFSRGKAVDATQEMLAIGLCNIANSFVQGFPGTGAIGRSAVNNFSGARTTLGGLYSGILVVVALLLLTPYFYYIPTATLSAVIISAVIFMIELRILKPMWNSKKSDFVLWFLTFIACLILPLVIGIAVGIVINLALILYHTSRPKISVERTKTMAGTEFLLLVPDRSLIFPSVDYVRKLITKQSIKQGFPVVIDCSHIHGVDYTSATAILNLLQDFHSRDQLLFFYNLKPSVNKILHTLCLDNNLVTFYDVNELDNLLSKMGDNV